jgi:hypothetical protein
MKKTVTSTRRAGLMTSTAIGSVVILVAAVGCRGLLFGLSHQPHERTKLTLVDVQVTTDEHGESRATGQRPLAKPEWVCARQVLAEEEQKGPVYIPAIENSTAYLSDNMVFAPLVAYWNFSSLRFITFVSNSSEESITCALSTMSVETSTGPVGNVSVDYFPCMGGYRALRDAGVLELAAGESGIVYMAAGAGAPGDATVGFSFSTASGGVYWKSYYRTNRSN